MGPRCRAVKIDGRRHGDCGRQRGDGGSEHEAEG